MSIQKIFRKVPRILWVLVPLALILWGAANVMVTRQAAPAGKPTPQYTEATSSSEASADQSDVVSSPVSQPSSSQPQIQIPPQDVVSAVVVPSQVFSTPLIAFGAENKEKSPEADPDLRKLMDVYAKLGGPDNIASAEAIGDYLASHPDSPWAVSLWQEKGGIEWRHGFFTDSITSLDAAWQRGKKATALDEKRLTEDGLSALLPKLAGAGRTTELRALVDEVKEREVGGLLTEMVYRAKETLWFYDNQAEQNVFCGFTAANQIADPLGVPHIYPDVHDEQEKKEFIANGLSLYELRAHSREAKGDLRILKREDPAAPLPVPSVVHWKFGHYSSITEAHDGRYRVKDFHLKFDSWVDPEAIKQEASGYLLASASAPVPSGFVEVSDAEAKAIFGRHCNHGRDNEGGSGGTAGGGGGGGSGGGGSNSGGGGSPPGPPPPPLPPQCSAGSAGSSGGAAGGGGGGGGGANGGGGNRAGGGSRDPSLPPNAEFNVYDSAQLQLETSRSAQVASLLPNFTEPVLALLTNQDYARTWSGVINALVGGAATIWSPPSFTLANGATITANPQTVAVLAAFQFGAAVGITINNLWGDWIFNNITVPLGDFLTRPQCTSSSGAGGGGGAKPMADYSFTLMNPGLQVFDTPVFYRPAYGPEISFRLEYDQRSTVIPDISASSNFGPRWTYRYSGYVENLGTGTPWSSVRVAFGTGDFYDYNYDTSLGIYSSKLTGRGRLEYIDGPSGGPGYRLTYADGSVSEYTQGNAAMPTRYYLRVIKDAAGNAVTVDYDANLRIVRLSDATGGITAISYTPEAGDGVPADIYKIRSITDPGGRQAKFRYNSDGQLLSITDPVGIVSSFTYAAGDFPEKLTTPYGDTSFVWGDLPGINAEPGRFVEATDPAGDRERIEANDFANFPTEDPLPAPSSITVAGQAVAFYPKTYNLFYRNTYYWDKWRMRLNPGDYSKATIYHWKALNNIVTSVLESRKEPLQARVWFNYPGQTSTEGPASGSSPSKTVSAVEDSTGATQWSMVQNEYHPVSDALIRTIDPLGRETVYEYDANGIDLLAVKVKDGSSFRILASYANYLAHKPRTITDAAGQITTYTYNTQGQVTSVTNPKNEITAYSYYSSDDSGKRRKGRLASVDGPLAGSSDTTSFDYDNAGNLASVTGPDGYRIESTYDAIGRIVRTTYPDGTFEETSYTRLDPTSRRDRLGRVTTMAYNSIRQLVSLIDPANRTTTFIWCRCGALRTLVDAIGRATNWEYDIQGRPIFKQYADGSKIRYIYQPLSGRLAKSIDEKAQVRSLAYNIDGTMAKLSYANALKATPDVSYSYDTSIARILSMTDGTGTTSYTYKNLIPGTLGAGQVASIDGPLLDDTITYTYDELGRRVGSAVNSVGEMLQFDALGRVTRTLNPLGSFSFTYAGASGRLERIDYPNGMSANFGYGSLESGFPLNDLHYKLADNSTLARFGYAYDVVGNITQWTQRLPSGNIARRWDITYDNADQLTGVVTKNPDTSVAPPTGNYSYTYDKAGNRLTETIDGATTTFTYNALNQLTGASGANSSPLPEQVYEWDAEDRLVAILYPGTDRRSEFAYDGLGRRVMVTEKTGSAVDAQAKFVWDGPAVLEQRDSAGAAVQKRYFGSGMQSLEGGQLAARFFARDHLGSVRSILASGSVAATIDYGPWGSRTATGTDPSGLGFAGHRLHSPSSLVLAPDRAYSPWQGRWASRYAFASGGGGNPYAYTGNRPTQSTGPR